jgi:hypothetical protein
MIEDKVSLTHQRAELIEKLGSATLSPVERVRFQGDLSIINAKIKAQNTTQAAQLKAAANRRKAAGLAEAQANAARARANAGLAPSTANADDDNDDDNDPGQTAAIDAWITTVLGDSGVKVKRTRDGLDFGDVPAKWLVVLQRLSAGIHATARGQELPEADMPEPPKTKKRQERS